MNLGSVATEPNTVHTTVHNTVHVQPSTLIPYIKYSIFISNDASFYFISKLFKATNFEDTVVCFATNCRFLNCCPCFVGACIFLHWGSRGLSSTPLNTDGAVSSEILVSHYNSTRNNISKNLR
jgi:hypothetical protein